MGSLRCKTCGKFMKSGKFLSCNECIVQLRIDTIVNLGYHPLICRTCNEHITCYQYMDLLMREKRLEDMHKQLLTGK